MVRWRLATAAIVRARSSDSSTIRRAPSNEASWRSAVSECSCSALRVPGGRTHSRSRSAPSRWAERQARRTRRCAPGVRLDQRQQPLADRLRRFGGDRLLARADAAGGGEPSLANLLGDLAQRDLAQRRQVLDLEEVVQRRVDPLDGVDLAGAQPLEQLLRREVDDHDLIGATEQRVRDRLAHADAAELGDLVVERFEVLNVDRGEHVDPGGQNILDVLVALGVLEPGRVGVGQLVDQAELGCAGRIPGRSISSSSVPR